MILVFDVGNTNIVMGIYKDKTLLDFWRLSTDVNRTADEYGMFINQLLRHQNFDATDVKAIVISTVVPSIMYTLEHMTKKYFRTELLIIGPGIKTGMNIKYDNPKLLGSDRLVNAVAAYELYGGPVIIVDLGTATKFCAVSDKGEYLGGAIAPGIKISSEALFQRTAKLPKVELVMPEAVICKNTVSCMQSGILYGHVGQVDYIVRKMKKELGCENVTVVATGGLSKLISTESETIDIVNGLLTLEGLRIIYERNTN